MANDNIETDEQLTQKFGPLKLHENKIEINKKEDTICLLCDQHFNINTSVEVFVKHLFENHQIVIEDVQNIQDLPRYIQYWRDKFEDTPIDQIVPSLNENNRQYYVLSTLLMDDKQIRHNIRLDCVLKIQEMERFDRNYKRQCLFCRTVFEGTRYDFIDHLQAKHNFYLGNPQNLVYIDELIDKINQKLIDLKCIYCDRLFPERNILKEHMRKKLHKKLNEHNHEYDRYFIINYLEIDKTWKIVQKEKDHDVDIIKNDDVAQILNKDEEYDDWNDQDSVIKCLLCEQIDTNINTLCLHMEGDHDFDFVDLTRNLDFYQKIKFVNYLRRQMHKNYCIYCNEKFDDKKLLEQHLLNDQHYKMPEIKVFDQPEYYFPTFEDDSFLYLIDDVED